MTAEIPASIAATAIPLEDDATQRLEQLGKAFDKARVKLRVLKKHYKYEVFANTAAANAANYAAKKPYTAALAEFYDAFDAYVAAEQDARIATNEGSE